MRTSHSPSSLVGAIVTVAFACAVTLISTASARIEPRPVARTSPSRQGVTLPTGGDWLDEINRYREAAGLQPVADNPAWDAGILDHLRYLQHTPASLLTGDYASAHTENPASPYYTHAGAQEAGSSDLMFGGGTPTPVEAVDGWLSAPFHAIGMLRSDLTQVALGIGFGGAGLDVISGLAPSTQPQTGPVLFPGPGIVTNLNQYGGESPDPLETCGWTGDAVGLPLIALLPQAPVPGLTAEVQGAGQDESTANGTLCVVDSNTYESSDPIYGPTGAEILSGDNAVLLIPRHPMMPGTYTASIQQAGQPDIDWSFNELPSSSDTTTGTNKPSGPQSPDLWVTLAGDKLSAGSHSRATLKATITQLPRGRVRRVTLRAGHTVSLHLLGARYRACVSQAATAAWTAQQRCVTATWATPIRVTVGRGRESHRHLIVPVAV